MHMRRVIAVLSFSLSFSSSNSSHKTRRSHLVPALLSHVVPRRGVQISQPGTPSWRRTVFLRARLWCYICCERGYDTLRLAPGEHP